MPFSRMEKAALLFGVLGAALWGGVAALRTQPLPAALRVFTNAGPNVACAFLAVCLLMLGYRLLCRRSPSFAALCAMLAAVFVLGVLSELFYFLALGHGFDAIDLCATLCALWLEWLVLRRLG